MKRLPCFAFMLASLATSFADDAAVRPSGEMNALIRSVHAEILKLKASTPWLAGYNDTCLSKSAGLNSIYYAPMEKDDKGPGPQQSSHFSLTYVDINKTAAGKYSNTFENVPACRFPWLHLKIYGEVLIRSDRELEKRLEQLVIAKCKEMPRPAPTK